MNRTYPKISNVANETDLELPRLTEEENIDPIHEAEL